MFITPSKRCHPILNITFLNLPPECAVILFVTMNRHWSALCLSVKNVGGPNLWGPHRIKSLKGVRVRTAASGPTACHSVIVTTEGKALSWGEHYWILRKRDWGQINSTYLTGFFFAQHSVPTCSHALYSVILYLTCMIRGEIVEP